MPACPLVSLAGAPHHGAACPPGPQDDQGGGGESAGGGGEWGVAGGRGVTWLVGGPML